MKKYDRNYEMQMYKTEEEQLNAVEFDIDNIHYIKNPSEMVQRLIIKQNSYNIRYIKNPYEEVQLEAVQKDGIIIEFLKNPSEKVIRAAILNGATKANLMGIHGVNWNKISDELWLQIQLM